jgi:hypothetical protein
MKFIKRFNEAYSRSYEPKEQIYLDTYSKWHVPGDPTDVYTVSGAGEKNVTYVRDSEPDIKLHDTITNFVKNFVKVEKPKPEEPRKQIYEDDNDIEFKFDEAIYIPGEKAIIAAYLITGEDDNFIDVMNIKELPSNSAFFMDGAVPYAVSINNVKLPKNKVLVLDSVDGKEGFSYIKLPYWLYKENPDLTIKKTRVGNKKLKRLDLRDNSLGDKELMSKFKDPNVEKYFKGSNPDERTLQLVKIYKTQFANR